MAILLRLYLPIWTHAVPPSSERTYKTLTGVHGK